MNLIDREQRDELVRLVLLELFKQADDRGLGAVQAPGQGGRPSGRPPAGAGVTSPLERKAVTELLEILKSVENSSGRYSEELRRGAELFELLGNQALANHWWKRAALAGDEDAMDYLEILKEEAGGLEVQFLPRRRLLADSVRFRRRLERYRGALQGTEIDLLMEEIEEYLASPDQVVDGGRRL
ncbi:hypothetical protein ACIP46_38675 [Streptomyces lavendulae]|uniref:hypothetical protein n=1 Tax=Streptomyces lavendulae TaxID=1914 RepID=UPI003818E305